MTRRLASGAREHVDRRPTAALRFRRPKRGAIRSPVCETAKRRWERVPRDDTDPATTRRPVHAVQTTKDPAAEAAPTKTNSVWGKTRALARVRARKAC